MKYFSNLLILFLLTVNLAAQENLSKDKEYKKLTKFLSSEIKDGGRSYIVRGFSSSETRVSKVKFRGCDVEIERQFIFKSNYPDLNSKVSPQDAQNDVFVLKGPFSTDIITFNLKYLDSKLFTTEPGEEKEVVRLVLKTKSEDPKIESKTGKVSHFLSKYKFPIRDDKSEEVLDSFKTLAQICRAKT